MPILGDKLFIHIPKCGGTSIEHSYGINTKNLNANYKIFFGRQLNVVSPYKHHGGIGYILQHLTVNELMARIPNMYKRYFTTSFTIVRNPLTRYISEIKWRHKQINNINKKPYYTKNYKQNSDSSEKKLQHYKHMYEFVYQNGVIMVNNIFHFENMDNVFKYINTKNIKVIPGGNGNNKTNVNTLRPSDLSKEHLHSVYDTFFMDYNLFGYLSDDVLTYYLTKHKGDNLIVTFTDFKYLPIFYIFYNNFKRLKKTNFVVISLDEKTFLYLRKQNIFTLLFKYDILVKNNFWDFRYKIINKLFKLSKRNIIHTDSDCIWLKDISNVIKTDTNYDIIAQMASGWPLDVVDKIGMVLCCGFYKLFYNDKTINILDEIKNKPYNKHILDDQIRINRYILHEHSNITDVEMGKCITIKKSNIKILLLKHKFVSRENNNKNIYLYHPFLTGTIEEKTAKLKKTLQSFKKSIDASTRISTQPPPRVKLPFKLVGQKNVYTQ